MVLTPQNIIEVFKGLLNSPEDPQPKICFALFSLYFTYCLLNNCYIEEVVVISMQIIAAMVNKVSAAVNSMRTQILLILSHHIIVHGPGTIFGIFNGSWKSY